MSTKQLTGKLALLMWVQKIASEYGIKVENFTSHFKDSRVLCAIINYYFPDELDFKSIKSDTQEEILNNFKAAFDIAEKHGVIKLLDPEDMLTPDTNSVMLYMAGMNKAFKPLPKGISSTKKEEALKEIIQDIPFQNIKQNVLQNLNINQNNNTNESSEEKEKLEKERQEKEKQEKERQEKEKQEKERLEKERQEKEIQEKIEKEKQEKEKFEKERERQELLEKERQQKEKLERERLEIERLEKERQENVKMEKEERQNLIQLETEEKERQEKENQEKERKEKERQERERQQKEKQESFEKTNTEKNKQPSEVKFQPSMVLSFLYLILGYFISGFIVDYTLFNFYFYIVLGIFFAISKWKPEINIFPILFSYLPYLLLILSNLDLQLIDLSLFIKSVLISKNLFKVHHNLTFIVSFLSSKVVLPLQDLLGIQTGGWSLSVFFVSRMVLFVIGILF